ncbi:sigma-70 family RNA polymerase sigma factor [Ilyomonas limi]|uniref:RNA polymerase sigma factor n=1 Tax=Ilyomonas limi TaxID=2575867 RepID=A0A4U3KXI8_9BACT|nr:sigma-70 family RNA polymerase sigma factor [Ilyomonas limi]TKK66404.1 sigma-70 family RNA polymerase sigma factor [Ilyomonas limi]
MNHTTDEIIIHKVLAGDIPAYSELVNRYSSMVFTLAYNIIINREDAEEIAQDVFIKAFTSLRSYKEQSKFATWLYRIVVNTALNKKKLRKLITADITAALTEEESADVYSLLQYERADMKQFVQKAVNVLPDNERICITMYYLNELSVNEISELTGITIANIKVLLHRGRKRLYTKLDELLKTELNDLK